MSLFGALNSVSFWAGSLTLKSVKIGDQWSTCREWYHNVCLFVF